MSVDITAFKELHKDDYSSCGFDIKDELDSFTLSSRLNDYYGTKELFEVNYDSKINNPEGHDILIYSREKISMLQDVVKSKVLGDDVTVFLNTLLDSQIDQVYIKIIG